jgi:hypothetical protein
MDPEEERVQLALDALTASGFNEKGYPKLLIQRAAATYNITVSKLTACWHGQKTRAEAHVHQQLLTPPQELVLKEWVKSLGLWGVPLTPSMVAEYAAVIIGKPVSTKWVEGF